MLFAFVELDLTITAIAIGVSLRGRRTASTVGAGALTAATAVVGLGLVWLIWIVAPACISDPNVLVCTADRASAGGFAGGAEIGLLDLAWTVGVALLARSLANVQRMRTTS